MLVNVPGSVASLDPSSVGRLEAAVIRRLLVDVPASEIARGVLGDKRLWEEFVAPIGVLQEQPLLGLRLRETARSEATEFLYSLLHLVGTRNRGLKDEGICTKNRLLVTPLTASQLHTRLFSRYATPPPGQPRHFQCSSDKTVKNRACAQ